MKRTRFLAMAAFLGVITIAGPLPAQQNCDRECQMRQSCNRGDMNACGTLAEMVFTGKGAKRDKPAAIPLYRKACNGGHMKSCSNLGALYETGFAPANIQATPYEAKRFYDKACKGNHLTACYFLATMLRDGKGIIPDERQAARLFRLTCDNGTGYDQQTACFDLGAMYEKGDGIRANRAEAKRYYGKSCSLAKGSKYAKGCMALKRLGG